MLIFKLWWDYRAKNKKKRIINHLQSSLIDGGIYLVSSVLLFHNDISTVFGAVFLALGFRWVAFDILFNLLNGWKWNHYGQSSKLDLFLKRCGKYHMIPKGIVLLIGIILILI